MPEVEVIVISDDEDPAPVQKRHKRGAAVDRFDLTLESEDATPESTQQNNAEPARHPSTRAVPRAAMDDAASPVRGPSPEDQAPVKKRRTAGAQQRAAGTQQQQQPLPPTPPTEDPRPAPGSQSHAGSGSQQQHSGRDSQSLQQAKQLWHNIWSSPQKQAVPRGQRQPATSSSGNPPPPSAAAKQQAANGSGSGRSERPVAKPPPRPAAAAAPAAAQAPRQQHLRQQQQQQHQEGQQSTFQYGFIARELEQYAPEQFVDRHHRSTLRSMIAGVHVQVEMDREQLVDPHQAPQVAAMAGLLGDTEQLGRLSTKTREAAAHAGLLSTVAATSVAMARNATAAAQQRRPADLVTALLRRYGPEEARHAPGAAAAGGDLLLGVTAGFEWGRLGTEAQAVLPGLRPAPCLDTMLGPLEMEVKLRRKVQRAGQRAPVEALVRPVEDKPAELQEQHATDAIVTDMLRVLRALPGGASPLLELVLDPHPDAGFAQTVENLFALSFLVKDARVSLTKDPDQGLLVTLVSEAQRKQHVADAAQHRGGTGHQLMLSLNMDDWEAMCTVATATHMPHRDPAPH